MVFLGLNNPMHVLNESTTTRHFWLRNKEVAERERENDEGGRSVDLMKWHVRQHHAPNFRRPGRMHAFVRSPPPWMRWLRGCSGSVDAVMGIFVLSHQS